MTSCAECLAWGLTYAQGVCDACYQFAAPARRHPVGNCGACGRSVPLKNGFCRLCWCQAREDRAVSATDPRAKTVLAPYLPLVRYQQLFLADLYRPRAPARSAPRRHGVKGRPLKPAPTAAGRPNPIGAQMVLLNDLPRTYRYGTIDLRSGAAPDNPWLAWALHLADVMSETHGFSPMIRRALNRNLVMLLATHADTDTVRFSDFDRVLRDRGVSRLHVIDVLSRMGVLVDDRPDTFELWLDAKLADLAPAIADLTRRWARQLRKGGPRRKPRHPQTVYIYVSATRPALAAWSQRYDHLREVTREDVRTHLGALRADQRMVALVALRSLFTWARRESVIFANPCARLSLHKPPPPIWQPMSDDDIAAALETARTPQAKVCVVLAAVHAARPGQIRALQLHDIDLINRQITIASHTRPLDDLTHRIVCEWLDHRRRRWPHTANLHLLVSKDTALQTGPVSPTFLRTRNGLPANLEKLRIDRQLEEALACGGDPLHLTAVFGLDETTAIRYATNALKLLHDIHAAPL
ncbi:hypothetical protein [Nocardia gipuzkoensis]|uniref:hypothetical protein n=1 Tax=Nocardia gipuzkoensis TaxID=2749991 RepID=UPI00237DB0EE|nr:hypothetical protein [Nocardia gipuzkoensis]MDE1674911.1 hypothetical protein [Nocardia gipuzkoensis]